MSLYVLLDSLVFIEVSRWKRRWSQLTHRNSTIMGLWRLDDLSLTYPQMFVISIPYLLKRLWQLRKIDKRQGCFCSRISIISITH